MNPRKRLLLRGEEPVPLTPKALETLVVLVENRERVVPKDFLMDALWPDSYVEESNLSQNIFTLRKALGDSSQERRYILTVPGRGYQFTETVREIAEEPEESVVVKTESHSRVVVEQVWPASWVWGGTAALAIVVLGSGFLGYRSLHHAPRPDKVAVSLPAVKMRRSVAVLGFHNVSERPDMAWLSSAFSEMLTTELAAGEHLRTIPEESVVSVKRQLSLPDADAYSKDTLGHIRANLGNDVVVVGSYVAVKEKGAQKIRLDMRVQNAIDGETLSSLSETGNQEEILDLVSRAGTQLRAALGVSSISASEEKGLQASLPSNREAARLYAEGLARLREYDGLAARDLLRRAVAADPSNALVHSALAASWSALGYDAQADTEAKKAIDLSRDLPREARLVVEGRSHEASRDWDKAAGVYKTLMTLFPDNLEYGLRLAECQGRGGNGQDALATVAILHRLPPPAGDDPRIDLQEALAASSISDTTSSLAAAERARQKAQALNATLVLAGALRVLGSNLSQKGDSKAAFAALDESRLIYEKAGEKVALAKTLNHTAIAHYRLGNVTEAQRLYEESLAICRAIGNLSCAATAQEDIAIILYEQSNFPEALRRYEEALAAHRLTGDLEGVAQTSNSIANVLADQGDQEGARKMYESSLATCRKIGDQIDAAFALNNLGLLLIDEGRLSDAHQRFTEALDLRHQIGDRAATADTLSGMGDLLLQQGDLAGARKMHEEALSIRSELGQKGKAADERLSLAILSLEDGNAAEAIQFVREPEDEFHTEKRADDEAAAHLLLASAFLAQRKIPEAQKEVEAAQQLTSTSENRLVRVRLDIVAARVQAARGNSAPALKILDAAHHNAAATGLVGLQFEARLAWGVVTLESGQVSAAHAALSALQKDAQAKGFGLIARKAASAQSPTKPAAAPAT